MRIVLWILKVVSIFLLLIIAACTVGPNYVRPCVEAPMQYKEWKNDWKTANPCDDCNRGEWWKIFHDPELDCLEQQVNINNQNIANAVAQYEQALALVSQAQASFFPTFNAFFSYTRQKNGALGRGATTANTINDTAITGVSDPTTTTDLVRSSSNAAFNSQNLNLNVNWEPDLWGSVRRSVEASCSGAQASKAQIASVRLSAQASLAQYYFQLRGLDNNQKLLDNTVRDYRRAMQLTINRYQAGTAAQSDVVQARSQLEVAQSLAINNGVNRALYEHAIAMLIGHPAGCFSIPPNALNIVPPSIPLQVPCALLERRPDIAKNERLVSQANAQIGVAIAAFYPTLNLSATGTATSIGSFARFLSMPALGWAIGPQLSQLIFDGGFRAAGVRAARANYCATVATYRQTVLTAFQEVEDNLATLRILNQQSVVQHKAAADARLALSLVMNQYRAGTVAYTNVLTAQITSFNAEITASNIDYMRMVAAVGLIKALGGGWECCRCM